MKAKLKSLRRLDLLAARWRRLSHASGTGRLEKIMLAELAGELETVLWKIRQADSRKR